MEWNLFAEGFLCLASFILDPPGDRFATALALQIGIV
jgi:hypothetical protein